MKLKKIGFFPFFSIVFFSFALAAGCSSGWKEAYRQKGFAYHQISYNLYPETRELYRVVRIGNVFFHFCGGKEYFDAQFRKPQSGVVGYAYAQYSGKDRNDPSYHVYLLSKTYKGRVIYDPAVLGHELGHVLNLMEEAFANPDRLKELDALK